jgi:hypothetical protein
MGNPESKLKKKATKSYRHILKSLQKSDPVFFKNQKDNPYNFYWQANADPDSKEEDPQWAPYQEEDNILLEYYYQKYKKEGQPRVLEIGEYAVDFEKWVQCHQVETWRQRKIIRASKEQINHIYRKNRFDNNKFITNYKKTFIEELKIDFNQEERTLGNLKIILSSFDIQTKIQFEYSVITFNVLPGKAINFLLLNSFKNQLTICSNGTWSIDLTMSTLKQKLEKEIDLHAESISRYNFYKDKYLTDLNETNFFVNIFKMYTEVGYLYTLMNKVLREKDAEEFKKIEVYYICLLAAFEYSSIEANEKFSKGNMIIPEPDVASNLKLYNKLKIYRGTYITDNEIEYYKTRINSNCRPVRIYNEFLSCSMNKQTAMLHAANCLVELELDFRIYEQNNHFIFLHSDLTVFSVEREILLRSGVIIQIHSFFENTNYINNINCLPQYILKGKVISFNDTIFSSCLLEGIEENKNKLDLWNFEIGKDIEKMKYFTKALKHNNFPLNITELDIANNSLGSNIENLQQLSDALIDNTRITSLHLGYNSLGSNIHCFKYLCDLLKKNKTITTLNLKCNDIGSKNPNLDYWAYLIDMINFNRTVTSLSLDCNSLEIEKDKKNMGLLSEALRNNKVIAHLDLRNNKISEKFIKKLKKIRESLKIEN